MKRVRLKPQVIDGSLVFVLVSKPKKLKISFKSLKDLAIQRFIIRKGTKNDKEKKNMVLK